LSQCSRHALDNLFSCKFSIAYEPEMTEPRSFLEWQKFAMGTIVPMANFLLTIC